ncbi:biliverdin-producing heme oxygenase [Flavobacterium psychrotrophum]|uniref:biliverdin-producing heme oxygenase n=1 Tax=Flavobacterium psychrotrophum TaxID=2294119 RepID=UPI000E311392|nr:biliverdin-producing heme oxygenase [Flavobacterium psychrotrophum]
MNNTVSAPTFLENLRSLTSESHVALEALPVSESILKPDVTDVEYGHYLTIMRDVVKDAEENIFPITATVITDLDSRNKTHLIEADLTAVGAVVTDAEKPLSDGIENLTLPFALGVLYVIEGSTLGGRVILKNINGVLGHDAEKGAAYFSGYGGQTGSRWKAFLDQFTAYEAANNAGEEIIAGANYAYNAINRHFSKSTV